ncbi:MAG: chemotaxis protein CheW [Planctomycetes bacterium]|uniref:chemotaxis protein CheW n=1 Tax=Candidatus Wunengus sp. YC65 TaxID=3367701 RepID=UPI001E0D22EC|nr:chemotaxis protein CheW [Planctomycetota bacterium]
MVNILVFKIGVNCFGIETAHVKSITKNAERVKDKPFPVFADGLVDYVFPDKRINKCREREFIIASFERDEFVMPIDGIVDIFQVLEKDIVPIPAFAVRHMAKKFFQGVFAVGEQLVLIVDVGKLLHEDADA